MGRNIKPYLELQFAKTNLARASVYIYVCISPLLAYIPIRYQSSKRGEPSPKSCALVVSIGSPATNGDLPDPCGVLGRPLRLLFRCLVEIVRDHEQLRVHGVAGDPVGRRLGGSGQHGLRTRAGAVADAVGAVGVVGPAVGPHALLHRGCRRHRQVHLRDGRLRIRARGLRGQRRGAARDARGVHAGRQRRHGLLRREPGGRVQPAAAGVPAGRRAGGQLRADRVHGGPQRRVPRRPPDHLLLLLLVGRGVQERVRGVRVRGVLLQRCVREPQHVQAVGVLAVLQERVPARVQLRIRRRDVHFHLRRRGHLLRHHLLPQHRQCEIVYPGRAAAAAHQQHHDVLRQRPDQRRRHRGVTVAARPSSRHRLACLHTSLLLSA